MKKFLSLLILLTMCTISQTQAVGTNFEEQLTTPVVISYSNHPYDLPHRIVAGLAFIGGLYGVVSGSRSALRVTSSHTLNGFEGVIGCAGESAFKFSTGSILLNMSINYWKGYFTYKKAQKAVVTTPVA